MRAARPNPRARSTRQHMWPAPTMGWVANIGLLDAPGNAAERLDNFFPTAQGAQVRGGTEVFAEVDGEPVRLIGYDAATPAIATASKIIFNYTSAADHEANLYYTSGDWSQEGFATAGGQFRVLVNGSDAMQFDGGSTAGAFVPVNDKDVYQLDADTQSGDFAIGETITGGTSTETAVVVGAKRLGDATDGISLFLNDRTGNFTVGETVTGGVSGATAVVTVNTASAVSGFNLTGVDTDALSDVWAFKQRLFFVEGGTMSAWYLPVDSIGGAASELTFGSVFPLGGSLLFGATWSADSGDGLDDRCIFVTTKGEMAVYEGTNPASASTWALVGVYYIGEPIDKHAHFRSGGEMYVVTSDGIIPISSAVSRDRDTLSMASLSYPIEDEWRRVIGSRADGSVVSVTHWPSKGMLVIGTPGTLDGLAVTFVANTRTGAWARYTNVDAKCGLVTGDNLYIGSTDRRVYKMETGGADNELAYTAVWIPKFSTCGTSNVKTASYGALTARSNAAFGYGLQVFADYNIGAINPPEPLTIPFGAGLWGAATWDGFTWGADGLAYGQQRWKAAGATGFTLAPVIALTVNQESAPSVEVIAVQLLYEAGSIL